MTRSLLAIVIAMVLAVGPSLAHLEVNWMARRLQLAERRFRSLPNTTYFPSPAFWPDHTVYQIMVDRFNNGNTSNDDLNLPPEQLAANAANSSNYIWDWRHGGDLQGIMDRLDYLQDLGVGTLWITPIFHHDGAYHGYCTTDLTQIDPGFGTEEDLIHLVQMAHERSIYVVLDVVINHMCDPLRATKYVVAANHSACPTALSGPFWAGVDNATTPAQGRLNFSDAFFAPFRHQEFFNRCGADSFAEIAAEDPAAVYGDFTALMLDYDTRSADFQRMYTDFLKYWVAAADIDGYRLDAAKHVTEDFIAYFSSEMRNYTATQLGKTNFFIVGEVAATPSWIGRRLGRMFMDPLHPRTQHGDVPLSLVNMVHALESTFANNTAAPFPGLNAVYDFDESGTSRSVLQGAAGSQQLQDYFSSTYHNVIAGQTDWRLSWTLLEIHDWVRFAWADPTNTDKVLMALGYLLTGPGTPIIYYGLEQGFNGRCAADSVHCGNESSLVLGMCNAGTQDSFKRQDMFVGGPWRLASTLGSITALADVGRQSRDLPSPPWQDDPFLDRNTSTYIQTRRLVHLRNSCSALRRGGMLVTWAGNTVGSLLAFNRNDGTREIVILVNPSGAWVDISTMKFYLDAKQTPNSGDVFTNALFDGQLAYSGMEGGNMYLYPQPGLQIGPLSIIVFVKRSEQSPTWDSRLNVRLCLQ